MPCENTFLLACGAEVANQSETRRHISYCYLKEPHHTHGHTWTSPISCSLTHIPLLG